MMDGWDWVWGALMMIAFWGGLAAVIFLAARAISSSSRRTPETSDAKAVLETRFAKGEISREELEEGRKVLDSA